jgi:hypothetical protein
MRPTDSGSLAIFGGAAVFLVSVCAKTIDASMKTRTEELAGSIHPKRAHEAPAPTRFDPKPWAVGQWIAIRAKVRGETVVQRTSVVAKDARGFWIETDTQDYHHLNLTKILFATQPHTANEALDSALAAVVREDAQPIKSGDFADASKTGLSKETLTAEIQNVVQASDEQQTGRENQTVTAGTFFRCIAYEGLFADGAYSKTVHGWAHPDVPLVGVVKAASDDGEVTIELLDYGDTGATSAFEPPPAAKPAAAAAPVPPAPAPPPPKR